MGAALELPTAVAEVFATDELLRREVPAPDYLREKLAIQDLARQMADHPAQVLPRLVALALEICDAESAGVSVLEGDEFRWFGLCGRLAVFEHATTPRNDSPCGVCLDHRMPILMHHPERAYAWIADANIEVPEVLLVPLMVKDDAPLGTLWVVASKEHHFHAGHARVLSELAVFTGIAVRMIKSDHVLKQAFDEQETLAREMSHRVKNLFAVTDVMIRMTARSTATKEDMTRSLLGRLHALSDAHSLVRRSFNPDSKATAVAIRDVIEAVLRPYRPPIVTGPRVRLGERATSSAALVFHELATNAAKYGALSNEDGVIRIDWKIDGENLRLSWTEEAGRPVPQPGKAGFGSTLIASTITALRGTIAHDWRPTGLAVAITLPLKSLER